MRGSDQSLKLLSQIEASVAAFATVGLFGLLRFKPDVLNSVPLAEVMAVIALIGFVYFFTLRPFIAKKHPVIAILPLTLLLVLDLGLLIAQTGGFDSSYYALWLMTLALSGLVVSTRTFGLLSGGTLTWLVVNSILGGHIAAHLPQAVTTIAAIILGWWLHKSTHQAKLVPGETKSLTTKLDQESLKTEILVNSIGDGVIIVDHELRIQLLNPAAAAMTGWDQSSALNLDWKAVCKLSDARDMTITGDGDPFQKAWSSGKSLSVNDLVLTNKAGRKVPLAMTISPIFNSDHTIGGGIAVFRDISAEKIAERERSEFISTASHEMRTPVAAIEGYLSLAMNPKVATIDDRAKGYLDKAHASTGHLGQLFQDLLSITKVEDHQLASHPEKFNLSEMVRGVVDDMKFTAEAKKLQLAFDPSPGNDAGGRRLAPPFTVLADQERLREVLTNLIDNALKFTQAGGVTVGLMGDDKNVTVSVKDTGIGIAAEDIPHLFQKFYRADNSQTRTIGGTGLGLYLARTIVELYGGKIWVESKLGEGSTFAFSLPLQDANAAPAATTVQPTTPPKMAAINQ